MTLRTCTRFLRVNKLAATLAVLVVVASGTATAEEFDHLPWELRAHFIFTVGESEITYAGDNTRWYLKYGSLGSLAEKVGFVIRLGDGTELTPTDFKKGKHGRNHATSPQGPGVSYFTDMATESGLALHHAFLLNESYPFYGLTMDVKNTSDKPVEIARIEPIQFPPGSFAALSDQTRYEERDLTARGWWPIFDPNGGDLSVYLHDSANQLTVVLGVLPDGVATSTPRFFEAAGGWQGGIVCEFNPPITLQPGESLRPDPVWLCFGMPNPDDVETLYAWTHKEEGRPYGLTDLPKLWVTVPAMESAATLKDTWDAWKPVGVEHVLVPEGWEGRPGSLEGAEPNYPKEMRRVAAVIRSERGVPGLTVDPLVGDGGNTEWSALTDDGITWINLRHPQGRAKAVERMRTVAAWDFAFFVVQQSSIPDAVLKHFNMTRHQADTLALQVMTEAAAGKPVLPSAVATVGGNGNQWQELVAGSHRMQQYELALGPVRLDTSRDQDFSADVVALIGDYNGPIEVVGRPAPSAARVLEPALRKKTAKVPARNNR